HAGPALLRRGHRDHRAEGVSTMRPRHETYANIFNIFYAAMVSNLLLVLGSAPLVLGLLTTDPARSWPLLAAVTPLCAPALVAVFAVFVQLGEGGGRGTLATFGRAWRASWR